MISWAFSPSSGRYLYVRVQGLADLLEPDDEIIVSGPDLGPPMGPIISYNLLQRKTCARVKNRAIMYL
jgi:hypothetical protein